MRITLKDNLKDVKRQLNKKLRTKDFNKIMAKAMNFTGEKIVNAERAHLIKRLDRPKDQTVRSIIITRFAKGESNKLGMRVSVKPWAEEYLHYIYSGDIEPARKNMYASPTREGLQYENKFGNIIGQKGLMGKIKPTEKSGRANSRFIGKPKGKGSGVYGVWRRTGKKGKGGLDLLVAFTPFIKHKKFIDFFKVGEMVVKNNFHKEVNKQYKKHLSKR